MLLKIKGHFIFIISIKHDIQLYMGLRVALVVKNPPASVGNERDLGSIPGSRRSLGGGHSNLLQYSFFFFFFLNIYLFGRTACGILVPWPGIKPISSALEAWSFNHWTTREVPTPVFLPRESHGQRSLVGYSL